MGAHPRCTIEQDLPTLSEAKKALPNLGREAPPCMYRPVDLAPLRVPEYTDQEVITPVHLRVFRAADANHWWLDWPVGVCHNYHRARRGDAVKRLQVVQWNCQDWVVSVMRKAVHAGIMDNGIVDDAIEEALAVPPACRLAYYG
ncbi:hypothetical protein FB107DRAFT_268420 [Schizophyllum commune]